MIRNIDELNITQNMISNFDKRLSSLSRISESTDIVQYEKYAIQAMLNDLNSQVEWFEKAIAKDITFNNITNINDIPVAIIGKRLQLGIDEKTMAQLLEISVDEYNLLELNDFYGIDKELLSSILTTLDIQNNTNIFDTNEASFAIIEQNLKKLNLNKSVLTHILPISFETVKESFSKHQANANYLLEKFLESFKNFFSIDLAGTISNSNDVIDKSFAVAFKRRVNTNASRLNFISAFAAHCAWIISKQMSVDSTIMRADPIEIRQKIIAQYSEVTLESCLDYIWNQNIGVLPLDISRGFHGACFDFEDKKVIALNQQNKSVSRWKFDLMHEFYHALTMDYNAYIERSDIMDQQDEEEANASLFASYVIFGSEMDSFVKMVLENCDGRIEYMKHSIEKVSSQYSLNIDDFSNYVAYKASGRVINFWGVAANLQQDKRSPNEVAKNMLFRYLDFEHLDADDLYLLQKILIEGVRI